MAGGISVPCLRRTYFFKARPALSSLIRAAILVLLAPFSAPQVSSKGMTFMGRDGETT